MKIVMIINKELPVGLAANTTAVLGVSLGRDNQILGPDCKDGPLNSHRGITRQAVPILGAAGSDLKKRSTLSPVPLGYTDKKEISCDSGKRP